MEEWLNSRQDTKKQGDDDDTRTATVVDPVRCDQIEYSYFGGRINFIILVVIMIVSISQMWSVLFFEIWRFFVRMPQAGSGGTDRSPNRFLLRSPIGTDSRTHAT